MTKTLTEQWCEGTLPQGNYYIVIRGIEKEQMMIDYYIPELHHFEIKPSECIKEVLAPVPSYEEWKTAKENLEKNGTWYTERSHNELLKQIERLQEQKQQAIALIKDGRFIEALQELENGY